MSQNFYSGFSSSTSTFPIVLVIPTGIGCSIGGYAGDGIPSARVLAAASGCLITHPNVMNAASLYWSDLRVQYVEGYSLDAFAKGEIALQPSSSQKIGLLLDVGITSELKQRHLQVVDGCRASLGLDIGPIVYTEVPLEISLVKGSSDSSWGTIRNPEALLRAGELLKNAGATAIAVVTKFPENLEDPNCHKYRKLGGVDALSGAEAVISHLLVKHLSIPCAHSPAVEALPIENDLDIRAVAEEIGHTFLPSVLVGLSRAPSLVPLTKEYPLPERSRNSANVITVDDIGAIVVPNGAMGGEAVLACIEKSIPIIAVSNPSVLKVTPQSLGIEGNCIANKSRRVLYASNYLEAAGFILALREGITIESLNRPLSKATEIIMNI